MNRFTKSALAFPLALAPFAPAFAASTGIVNSTVNGLAQTYGFGTTNLTTTIFAFIGLILGFLALITFVLIVYAGVMWMTAGGSEEKVQKAQGIIRNAVIGLLIIMASWGIVLYLSTIFSSATGTSTTS